jgi:hypothetical protein
VRIRRACCTWSRILAVAVPAIQVSLSKPARSTAMTLQPGTIIEGKYRIDRMLGKGGMGAVYEGEIERIHRRVK